MWVGKILISVIARCCHAAAIWAKSNSHSETTTSDPQLTCKSFAPRRLWHGLEDAVKTRPASVKYHSQPLDSFSEGPGCAMPSSLRIHLLTRFMSCCTHCPSKVIAGVVRA
eukprot:349848-Pleurochrysis_carterae.AAC.2